MLKFNQCGKKLQLKSEPGGSYPFQMKGSFFMPMADNIKLTIDGTEIEIERGATVLQAAQSAGLYIPTLCYHPNLQSYGGCRLCIVEIENMRGLPTACTTPAPAGMKVTTSSARLQELRRAFLQL